MELDAYFAQGRTHDICQDYAITGNSCTGVADGCSIVKDKHGHQVATATDFGARLILQAAINSNYGLDPDFMFKSLVGNCKYYVDTLRIRVDVLTSTLLFLRRYEDNIHLLAVGDGNYFARYRGTQNWRWTNISFNDDPYYLRYVLVPGDYDKYLLENGGKAIFRTRELVGDRWGDPVESSEVMPDFDGYYHSEVFPLQTYDLVLVTSDVLNSFTIYPAVGNPELLPEGVLEREILRELLRIRNTSGVFLKRTYRRINDQLKARHIFHGDDFSIAGIAVPTFPEPEKPS